MKNIMIATPTYDYKVSVYYIDTLLNTLRNSNNEFSIAPVFIPGDALIQRARNDLFKIAKDMEVDELIWIDADIVWKVEDFYRLLSHKLDFVAGIYIQKSEEQRFCFRPKYETKVDENNLLEVKGVGMGFCKMSKNCIDKLWDISKEYTDSGGTKRMVFEVTIDEMNELTGEDVAVCLKWQSLGEKVYVDTSIVCIHIGQKMYFPQQQIS